MRRKQKALSLGMSLVMMFSSLMQTTAVYAAAEEENIEEMVIVEESVALADEGSEGDPFHVAVYDNTLPTLPEQVDGVNITWPELSAEQFSEPFDMVTVTGTTEDGGTVTASVEVVPENLVYFIDSGTGTEWGTIMEGSKDASAARNLTSLPYLAVKDLVGDALLNEVSDQYYETGRTWGVGYTKAASSSDRADPIQTYWNNNVAPTDGSDITNKYAAGLRASNSTNFEYYLTLEAGTYTLTTGFHEFYNGNHNRGMAPKVYDAADDTLIAALDTVSMSNNANSSAAPDITSDGTFTLAEKTLIKVHYEKTSGENGSMNWLAVVKKTNEAVKGELETLIAQIQANVQANQDAGVTYAETPLEPGQYTGAGEAPKDNLQDLQEALANGEALLALEDASMEALNAAMDELQSIYENLRTMPGTYTTIPGTSGDVIQASNTGLAMQAHGGSASVMKEGIGEGCVNYDLDGDGQITEGKTVYMWYGENKTNNTRPVDGVRCYVSTDLYNWKDMGNVLYLQNSILPVEFSDEKAITSSAGASGTGTTQSYNALQVSETNLEILKAWGRLETAPEGVSEEDFGNVKLFLRAYVTAFDKEPTGLYDTTWTALTYDETPVTASSFLYPDSETAGTVETTRLQLAFEGLFGDYCITERPKMIYNEATGKFVIVFHADGPLYNNEALNNWVTNDCQGNCTASRYGRAMVGFAESDTPFGPFKLVNMTRMNYDTSLNANRLGESRDMTVFVDQGVDNNQDGVDDAYVVYSSEMNAKLYVSLLNADYTGPIAEGDTAEQGVESAYRILSDNSREAPAIMKYDGWYYLITSGTDGWNSTAHIYYRSQNMLSGWEKVGNPALDDTGKCFDTQVTYVLPIDAENGKFIYMGDRWNGDNLTDSRTIWLPIQVNSNHTISILNKSYWTWDLLDSLAPVKVYTEIPEIVYADGSNLPETICVSYQGETVESAAVWSENGLNNMGNTTLTATLTDCNDLQVQMDAFVTPWNLVYFVNSSSAPLSDDYNKIVEVNKATLKNAEINDGAYSADTGFGYTGAEGKVRGNNTDIYQSMRYASAKADSIVYQFDLAEGNYEVYIGMFDPAAWYQSNQRYADISLNGILATEKYAYLNNTNDTLHYTDVTPDENGHLTVTVAPNTANTAAVQVSFIMIVGEEEPEKELAIIQHPADVTAKYEELAEFTVVAEGNNLSYQWQYSNANSSKWYNSSMEGCQTATVSVPVQQFRDGQKYRCIVTDGKGNSLTSESAKMTVSFIDGTLEIIQQPEDCTGVVGETAIFSVTAQGTGLSYQWQYCNASSSKWFNSSMTGNMEDTISVTVANYRNGQKYRCVVSDADGNTVTTKTVKLIVAD